MVWFQIVFKCNTQGTILIELSKLLRMTACQSTEEPNKTNELIIDTLKDSFGSVGNVPTHKKENSWKITA
jgi:hypothetical protein